MGELSLHVTVRDDRSISAPFTLTASVPGLERWDKPAVFTFVHAYAFNDCTRTNVHVYACSLCSILKNCT